MTADVTAAEPFAAASPLRGLSRRRVSIGFLNWAHALDHFVMLVYPTVVIELQAVYGRSYSELIGLSTASFIAFGLFSLPAGWLADRWSRRNMMVAFYLGCGGSLIAAAFSPSLVVLTVALFVLGIFAAIYHPVGTAMVIESSTHRGRTMAFNGVCGNLGISLAAGITAILTAAVSWRGAFFVPGIVCVVTGVVYVWLIPDEAEHRSALAAGLVFNTLSVALPKIVDERVSGISLVEIGGLTTAVFICGAIAQMAVGRLVERFRLHILFAVLAIMQFCGVVWTAYASGVMVLFALAFTMAAIYGQITVNDLIIARYTADAWRGRVFAVRYFLTFMISGLSVSMIAFLYGRGGFPLVLGTTAFVALAFLIAVLAIAYIAANVERARVPHAMLAE
jgi:MFS family permease